MTGVVVRKAAVGDVDVLVDALVAALDWRGDQGATRATVAAQPDVWHYVDGWMRLGDFGVVAELAGIPIGAAWARLMPAGEPGYGFVDVSVPELTAGVAPGHRGRGVGRLLMTALLDEARAQGVPGLSLSVEDGNDAARHLYESCGFTVVGRNGDSDTLVLWL